MLESLDTLQFTIDQASAAIDARQSRDATRLSIAQGKHEELREILTTWTLPSLRSPGLAPALRDLAAKLTSPAGVTSPAEVARWLSDTADDIEKTLAAHDRY